MDLHTIIRCNKNVKKNNEVRPHYFLEEIKEKSLNAFKVIEQYYKRIQDGIAPNGSYVVATLPFYFLYKFSLENIEINEKMIVSLLVVIAIILNIFKTKWAVLPISSLLFFSLWNKNLIIAIITVVIAFIISSSAKMVKKGKYVFPIYIMLVTGCLSKSFILPLISILFSCSLLWGDGINSLTISIVAILNLFIVGGLNNKIENIIKYYHNRIITEAVNLNEYFSIMLLKYVKFVQSLKDLGEWLSYYAAYYIVIFIGIIIVYGLFLYVVKKQRINRFKIGYVLISHFLSAILIYAVYLIADRAFALNMAVRNYGEKSRWLDSLNNFFLLFGNSKEFMPIKPQISFAEAIVAFLISIPISLFINGYDSQRKMYVSQTSRDADKVNKKTNSILNDNKLEAGNDDVYWNDIAGYESTKKEIQDTIAPYVDPIIRKKLIIAKMDLPKGILLFGPPGCGKTMFAKAIANESNMNFISVKGNEFTSKWVGESEKNLREIFESARKKPPSIIFFDELEAFLMKRENTNDYNKSLITTFLTEMDGFAKDDRFLVIGATNNPDMLDSAAIRPGRFDKCIYIDTPNSVAREAILRKYLNKKGDFSKEEINELVSMTNRYSGADLRSLIEETFTKNRFNSINFAMLKEMISHYKPTMDYEMKNKFNKLQAKYNRSTFSQVDIGITNRPKVTWDDAPGLDDVKEQIKELIEKPLKYSKRYKELGLSHSKGILMYGPPGCGKTLVSKIIASQYELYFIPVNGPELLSKNVGESEEQVRKVFMEAKDNAPAIIFFDEFDSIAEQRDNQVGGTKIINQLLTEMDGNENLEGVIVVGATNRIEVIDSALRRPGRFDKILYVGLPNEISRESQIKMYLKKLIGDYNYNEFAKLTDKFTCADIAGCCKKIMLKELDLTIENEVNHVTNKQIIDIIKSYQRSLSDMEIERYENTIKYERK